MRRSRRAGCVSWCAPRPFATGSGPDYLLTMPSLQLCSTALTLLLLMACSSSEESAGQAGASSTPSSASPPAAQRAQGPSPNSDGEPQPDRRFPAAAGQRNPPLHVGQWVRYSMNVPGGGSSDVFYRVTGQEGDEVWVEVERRVGDHQNIMAMRVTPPQNREESERPVPSAVRSYNTRSGEVQELPGRLIREYSAMLDPFVAAVFFPWPAGEGVDVATTAGRFSGAIRAERSQELLGSEVRAVEWFHAAVPITGMLQFRSETNAEHQMQLHSFGEQGAVSALPGGRP